MRELHYGNGILVVAVDVCNAVFAYAKALANANKSDVVTIPILVNGERATSNLLLGPASQLFCTPSDEPHVDLDDPGLVDDLRARARLLSPSQPVPVEHTPVLDFAGEYE